MSFFEDASLVLIPSAQKTSKVYSVKPTDGSGDLTFTRSNDTATRVASNGLIERVRTNLILQSNSFDTTWTNTTSTETSGQAGYDGTNNAWLLAKSNFNGRIEQTISASGSLTFSVYAKAGTKNFVFLRVDGGAGLHTSYFDLQNGTTGISALCTPSIEAAGNGYYRCSIAFNDTITIARIYVGDANGDTSATSGNILIQASQLESGDIMTDYIATTSAAVSVGPVANVPRLDYLNSSCPRLLLEPQRTNLALYSEQFDNAAWSKYQSTITANATTSPDGYSNADFLVENTANDEHSFSQAITTTNAAWTISVFAKANGRNWIALSLVDGTNTRRNAYFNIASGAVGTTETGLTASIVDYGNGWYRCVATIAVGRAANAAPSVALASADNTKVYVGDGTSGAYLYGFQTELGAYATSYIPTLGAAVTRGADAASKTGISSLIGQTEGTVFIQFDISEHATRLIFNVDTGSTSDYISALTIGTSQVRVSIRQAGAVSNIITSSSLSLGRHKIAVAYKSGDYALYIDGVQAGVSTSTAYPVGTLIQFVLASAAYGQFGDGYNQAIIFPTRLSNADLAALTA